MSENQLDYGKVAEYDPSRGFGFLERTIWHPSGSRDRAWFHISVVRRADSRLADELDEGAWTGKALWFIVERRKRGIEATQVWARFDGAPRLAQDTTRDILQARWLDIKQSVDRIDEATRLAFDRDEYASLEQTRALAIAEEEQAERRRHDEALAELRRSWSALTPEDKCSSYFDLDDDFQVMHIEVFAAALCQLPLRSEVTNIVLRLGCLSEESRLAIARKAVYASPIPLVGWALQQTLPRMAPDNQIAGVERVMANRSPNGQGWLYDYLPTSLALHPKIRLYGHWKTVVDNAIAVLREGANAEACLTIQEALAQEQKAEHRDRVETSANLMIMRAYEWDLGKAIANRATYDQECALIICALLRGEVLASDHPVRSSTHALTTLFITTADARILGGDFATASFGERLEEYIADVADMTEAPICLGMLLSTCMVFAPLQHCEARRAPNLRENMHSERVCWCPRLGKPAVLRGRGVGSAGGDQVRRTKYREAHRELYCGCGHVYPLRERYTLVEMLPALGPFDLPGLRHDDTYATWLAGYVNRLNDIRELMKCSQCGERLSMDRGYALRLARYRGTVGRCRKEHEQVYFNHCWHCGGVIDSRESSVSVNELGHLPPYICIRCGAGPKNDYGFIGSLCPHRGCGQGMSKVADSPNFKCPSGHEIDSRPNMGVRLTDKDVIAGKRSCGGHESSTARRADATDGLLR